MIADQKLGAWSVAWDDASADVYYWNKVDGVQSWDPPRVSRDCPVELLEQLGVEAEGLRKAHQEKLKNAGDQPKDEAKQQGLLSQSKSQLQLLQAQLQQQLATALTPQSMSDVSAYVQHLQQQLAMATLAQQLQTMSQFGSMPPGLQGTQSELQLQQLQMQQLQQLLLQQQQASAVPTSATPTPPPPTDPPPRVHPSPPSHPPPGQTLSAVPPQSSSQPTETPLDPQQQYLQLQQTHLHLQELHEQLQQQEPLPPLPPNPTTEQRQHYEYQQYQQYQQYNNYQQQLQLYHTQLQQHEQQQQQQQQYRQSEPRQPTPTHPSSAPPASYANPYLNESSSRPLMLPRIRPPERIVRMYLPEEPPPKRRMPERWELERPPWRGPDRPEDAWNRSNNGDRWDEPRWTPQHPPPPPPHHRPPPHFSSPVPSPYAPRHWEPRPRPNGPVARPVEPFKKPGCIICGSLSLDHMLGSSECLNAAKRRSQSCNQSLAQPRTIPRMDPLYPRPSLPVKPVNPSSRAQAPAKPPETLQDSELVGSEVASEVASDVASDVAPDVASEVAPDVASDVAPDVASEVSPDEVPSSNDPLPCSTNTEHNPLTEVANVDTGSVLLNEVQDSSTSEATDTPAEVPTSHEAVVSAPNDSSESLTIPSANTDTTPALGTPLAASVLSRSSIAAMRAKIAAELTQTATNN